MRKRLRAGVRTGTVVAMAALLSLPATALARFGDRTLSTGSTGHDVRVLQSWLDKMGFHTGIDGAFGRHTRWSLRRFEQAKRLRVNGVLSPDDARVMRQAMSSKFSFTGDDEPTDTAPAPASKAAIDSDGLHAVPPADAPPEVQEAITAANRIVGKPYKY